MKASQEHTSNWSAALVLRLPWPGLSRLSLAMRGAAGWSRLKDIGKRWWAVLSLQAKRIRVHYRVDRPSALAMGICQHGHAQQGCCNISFRLGQALCGCHERVQHGVCTAEESGCAGRPFRRCTLRLQRPSYGAGQMRCGRARLATCARPTFSGPTRLRVPRRCRYESCSSTGLVVHTYCGYGWKPVPGQHARA